MHQMKIKLRRYKTYYKKYGLNEAKLTTTRKIHTIENPVLEGKWEIDIHKYKMGLLKLLMNLLLIQYQNIWMIK